MLLVNTERTCWLYRRLLYRIRFVFIYCMFYLMIAFQNVRNVSFSCFISLDVCQTKSSGLVNIKPKTKSDVS